MNPVTITNIDIPFWRAVAIILKWMLASIPAMIILYLFMALISIGLFAVFGGVILGTGMLDGLDSAEGLKNLPTTP